MPARVSLLRCNDYAAVPGVLSALLAPLGGMAAFVRPGQTVLLKPNLLTDARPEQAVTTHPEVVRGLLRMVKAAGGIPVVGDSPANVADLEKVWEQSGFKSLCAEEGVALLNFEKAGSRHFELRGVRFTIAQPVLDADVVINVPKVKTHSFTILTAAVKNLYGTVPGFQKTDLHKQYPRPQDFAAVVAAVYQTVRPALSVADGVIALEGDGPSSGGSPMPLGILAASADAMALDGVLCRLLGIPWQEVLYLAELARHGAGTGDTADIELAGDRITDRTPSRFRRPAAPMLRRIPLCLVRPLQPLIWTRPVFTARCVRCGQCVRACPTGAICPDAERRPVLTPPKCIACCCCHEICPADAIVMTPSPLLRAVARIRRVLR